MIKAIFFDLDGTLLDSNKKIQQSSIKALKKCKEKGIKIFLASARPPLLEKMFNFTEEEKSLFDGGVYCNGGCIKIDDICQYMYIPPDLVSYILVVVKQYQGVNIALQMEHEIHAFRYPLLEHVYEIWGIDQKDALSIEEVTLDNTVKVLIYYENVFDFVTKLPIQLVKELSEYCKNKATLYVTDESKLIQIVNQETNKKDGIEKARKLLKLAKNEIAVFGDDVNDIEMLSEYKHSVAMGNASQEIQAIAQIVTKDNDHNGIAYGIEQLMQLFP